jgi:sugar O-acyltransferase (sialic acid O-acetyltransferase NeuD family)
MIDADAARDGDGTAIYIAGTGSFAAEVIEYATAAGLRVAALVELIDAARVGSVRHGLSVIAPDAALGAGRRLAVIGVAGDRLPLWSRLDAHGWTAPAAVIHPGAIVSESSTIEAGCVIGPRAVVGAASRLRAHVLIGRGALIGHHVVIEDGVTVNPGANIGGNSRIGAGARIGMGATVINTVSVGAGATVAAGAVVIRDVPDGARVQGVPARLYQAGEAPC